MTHQRVSIWRVKILTAILCFIVVKTSTLPSWLSKRRIFCPPQLQNFYLHGIITHIRRCVDDLLLNSRDFYPWNPSYTH